MDSAKLSVHKFDIQDEAQLIQFWQTAFPNEPAHNAPNKTIKAKLAIDDLIFIARYKEKIVGACMAGYDGHRGWLYSVAVDQDFRRFGIGKKLVMTTIDSLKELGCIKLNLQIRADNTQVADFYRSLGFGVEERMSMGKFI